MGETAKNIKSQPWIHSWYGDSIGFFAIPFIFFTFALFNLPPFNGLSRSNLTAIIYGVLILDWGHIFAQWFRIYLNPAESKRAKYIYSFSYLLLIPILTLMMMFVIDQPYVESFLVYFVIYHFIKQHFGFVRIYSKIDGVKTKVESFSEDLFVYLTMWVPVIYWHIKFPYDTYYWVIHFIKIPFVHTLFYVGLSLYCSSFLIYVYFERKRFIANKIFNMPKNLAIISAALGWGAVSFFNDVPVLIFFTVVLTHDFSYLVLIWFIGRRDEKTLNNKVRWISFWSVPGAFIYVLVVLFVSRLVIGIHAELVFDMNKSYFLIGTLFNSLSNDSRWLIKLGWSVFFATQGHHYFIDKYLWKKEKDFSYLTYSKK